MNPRRPRRNRQVMELLAQARPDRLDPEPDPGRRATALASLTRDQSPAAPLLQTAPSREPAVPLRLARPARPVPARLVRPMRRRAALGTGLALAAGLTAVTVFAVTTASSGPAKTGKSGQTGQTGQVGPARALPAPTARQILLTAAVSAARQPASGRYWRVEDVNGYVTAAGPNAHPYAVEQRYSPEATWDARSARQRTWTFPATGYRSMLPTAGAAAAWRADGSPRLSSQSGRQQAWWQTGGVVGYLGNDNLTFAQFQRLPSEPSRLATVVRTAAEQQIQLSAPPHGVKSWKFSLTPTLSQDMFGVYDQLLKNDPITPQVRAAVFTDLAKLPGVRTIGRITDPLGRIGYGIALGPGPVANPGQDTDEEILVIAPGSGLLLADEFVVVKPSGAHAPASGARPGLAACPAGTQVLRSKAKTICELTAAQAQRAGLGVPVNGKGKPELATLGPLIDLAVGQVDSYDAVISAGWTNAAPQLPPPGLQFSVAKDGKG